MQVLKDPDAKLDYQFDWSDWLNDGDTIASYSLTVESGLTLESDSFTDTAVTVWLSGGDVDENYEVTCHIITAEDREDDRTLGIRVRQR